MAIYVFKYMYEWLSGHTLRVFSPWRSLSHTYVLCVYLYIYMYSYSMYGWMDGRTDGGRDGWMDAWMHVWMNACMHVYIYNHNNIYILYAYIDIYAIICLWIYVCIYIYTCILDNTTKIYGLWWVMYIHRRGMKTTFTLCNLLIPQTPYIEP